MPFYEYRCGECAAVHEAFHKMSDPPLETCPSCGGPLSRVLHPVAVHFKGSGFYTTDYGRTGKKKGSDGPDGYEAVEREKYRRAEQGDPLCTRVVEAESSKPKKSSGNGDASKEKQKAS